MSGTTDEIPTPRFRTGAVALGLLGAAAVFAAGFAVGRGTADRADVGAKADTPAPTAAAEAAVLAARPASDATAIAATSAAAEPDAAGAPKPDGPPASEPFRSVTDAVQKLDQAITWRNHLPAAEEEGERAVAFLESQAGRDDREVGLVVARWLAAHGRAAEARRRVLAQIGRQTPTVREIAWLSEVDPRAGVAAARTLVERKPGSPDALVSLAESLAAAGDTAAAFDAYAAALRAGLAPNNGATELARLDPERAIAVLVELYAGRDVGAGARALVEAYLRSGRVADAGRELIRLATSQDGENGLLEAAAILEPEATSRALSVQFDDVAASAASDLSGVMAYGVALRRAGHRAEALSVLRAVAERPNGVEALAEMLRCDAAAARAYVEAHLPDESHPTDRIRVLGMLGRRDEATAMFERLVAARTAQDSDWVALVYAAPDRAIAALRQGVEKVRGSNYEAQWRVSLAQALTAVGRTAEAKSTWAEVPDRDLDLELLAEKAALR